MNNQLRAVALCRCSTEEESQKDALVKQVKEAKQCIEEHGWLLVDTYVESKSGTVVKGRQEYNRLYKDLETDKFDIVVIKSIDRLMRNVKEWYLFIEKLVKNYKQLYMYLERKFYSPDDALITGIKAILAEEYSRELSKKINNAHKHRQEEGNVLAITNATYGYTKLKDKSIIINEQERPLIEKIFEYSAAGYGTTVISQLLYKEGFFNRKGEAISPHVILRIIKNPLYMGTAVLNKQHFDFNSKQTIRNPKSEWIVHKNALPAIITEELFNAANEAVQNRVKNASQKNEACVSERHNLEGLLVCGLCGKKYHRTSRKLTHGEVLIEWRCCTYVYHGRNNSSKRRKLKEQVINGCDNVHLNEEKLYQTLNSILNTSVKSYNNDDLAKMTLGILRKALSDVKVDNVEKIKAEREQLIKKKKVLLDKLLEDIITNEDYKSKTLEIEQKIQKLEGQLRTSEEKINQSHFLEDRIKEVLSALKSGIITKVKTDRMLRSVKEIKVYPETLEVYINPLEVMGDNFQEEFLKSFNEVKKLVLKNDCTTSLRPGIEQDKLDILEYLKSNPKSTIKNLAICRGESQTKVWKRVNELKAEGKLRYSTPNGRGYWIVEE